MREPLTSKVKCFIRRIIKKIFRHEYGCCDKIFFPCRKCCWVIKDQAEEGEI